MTTTDTAACRRVSTLAKLYAIQDIAARTGNASNLVVIHRMVHEVINEMVDHEGPEVTAEYMIDALRRSKGNAYRTA